MSRRKLTLGQARLAVLRRYWAWMAEPKGGYRRVAAKEPRA